MFTVQGGQSEDDRLGNRKDGKKDPLNLFIRNCCLLPLCASENSKIMFFYPQVQLTEKFKFPLKTFRKDLLCQCVIFENASAIL